MEMDSSSVPDPENDTKSNDGLTDDDNCVQLIPQRPRLGSLPSFIPIG